MKRKLPPGYEIRSVEGGSHGADGQYVMIVPYYKGRPISTGKFPNIYGFRRATREARKAIRIHQRWGMDGHR
jgi:hypothetical protein